MKWLYFLLLFTLSFLTIGRGDELRVERIYEKKTLTKKEVKETEFIKNKKKEFVERLWNEFHNHTELDDSTITTLIAQSAIESRWGNCSLSKYHNNYYGMTGFYKKRAVLMPTREYIDGSYIKMRRFFRSYPSIRDCLNDRIRILHVINSYATAPQYWDLVNRYRKKVESSIQDIAYTITTKTEIEYGGKNAIDDNDYVHHFNIKAHTWGNYDVGLFQPFMPNFKNYKLNLKLYYGEARESGRKYKFKKYPFRRSKKDRAHREFRDIFQGEDRGSSINSDVIYVSFTAC